MQGLMLSEIYLCHAACGKCMAPDHDKSCKKINWALSQQLPLYRHNVFIEASTPIAHVPKVTEYKRPVDIKSAGNDVFAVFPGKPL